MSGRDGVNDDVVQQAVSRRRMLELSFGVIAAGLLVPGAAVAAGPAPRSLSFHNLHTGERLSETYWADGQYIRESLSAIDYVLRDFRTGDVVPIDLRVLDLLHAVRGAMRTRAPFELISGYRSPKTNAMLAKRGHGVAKRSLHVAGMAVDVRLPGRDLAELRRVGRRLRLGGVGYYPKSGFVHLDVGRVRYW